MIAAGAFVDGSLYSLSIGPSCSVVMNIAVYYEAMRSLVLNWTILK